MDNCQIKWFEEVIQDESHGSRYCFFASRSLPHGLDQIKFDNCPRRELREFDNSDGKKSMKRHVNDLEVSGFDLVFAL